MTLAFFCHHMNQNRPANLAVFQIAQNRQQMFKIMAIYRANMEKAQLAEQAVPADQITRAKSLARLAVFRFLQETGWRPA